MFKILIFRYKFIKKSVCADFNSSAGGFFFLNRLLVIIKNHRVSWFPKYFFLQTNELFDNQAYLTFLPPF